MPSRTSLLSRLAVLLSILFFSAHCTAASLCNPNDNNARILSAPSPNAIDPQWAGDNYIGTGWSLYVTTTVKTATGLFAKGNLHTSRNNVAQKGVYILLSEWTCAPTGPEVSGGIDGVDAADTTPSFNCAEESGAAEQAICSDGVLAALDRRMAEVYGVALASHRSPGALKIAQRIWLQQRSRCGGNKDCIQNMMVARISDLDGSPAEHPENPGTVEYDAGPTATAPEASKPRVQSVELSASTNAPLTTFKDCEHCPEMVALPTGSYLMGAGPDDRAIEADSFTINSELPRHQVTIAYPIAFSKFELTVEEFAAYVDETGAKTGGECLLRIPETGPSQGQFIGTVKPNAERYPGLVTVTDADFRTPGAKVSDRQPATCISRREAEGYLEWLSKKTGKHYRLPSESEWEYAARAGTTTAFYFGNSRKQLCGYGNFADRASPYNANFVAQCAEKPSPPLTAVVGSYKPNPWGLYDMAGNVFEFTADCISDNYNNAPIDGSPYVVPGCTRFIQRSYTMEAMDTLLRSAARCADGDEDSRSNILGLRVVLDMSATPEKKAEMEHAVPATHQTTGSGHAMGSTVPLFAAALAANRRRDTF